MLRIRAAWFLVFACCASLALPTQASDDLEKQLLEAARKIIPILKSEGCRSVGTLKFQVVKGIEPASDRVGSFNQRLSDRLEMALILANKVRDPIGVIHDANRIAAKIPGANHLRHEGRQQLFSKEYPMAWGDEQVVPDAFLTGVAEIAADLKTMKVGLLSFSKFSDELEKRVQFIVRVDLDDLIECGESFTIRDAFNRDNLQLFDDQREDKAVLEAVQNSPQTRAESGTKDSFPPPKPHPLAAENVDSPISLEIRYDDLPQAIEYRNGAAFVVEPKENQKISFAVRRKMDDHKRWGIVLKVNGENTIHRETLPDARCSPWVFEPYAEQLVISGFHINRKDKVEPFTLSSQPASKANEIDYGTFVGTISISVFQEQTVKPKGSEKPLSDDDEDIEVMTVGVFPGRIPRNFGALRVQLCDTTSRRKMPFIPPYSDTFEFKKDCIPAMTTSIRYYRPCDSE